MTTSVASLAADYWEGALRASPRWATQLGDHRFDDRLEDLSPDGKARERRRLERLRDEVGAARPVDAEEQLTLEALALQVASDLDVLACDLEEWTVDPLEGPQVSLFELVEVQEATTPEQRHAMIARWRAIAPFLDQHAENLRRGLASGRVATRDSAEKVVAQLDELLARPVAGWSLLAPLEGAGSAWFRDELTRAVVEGVKPGFERLRELIAREIVPSARGSHAVGLGHVAGGAEAYRRLVRVHTSLDLSPDEIHRIGLAEVARVRSELEALGARLFATGDLAALRARVTGDTALFFATRDEVREKAEATLRRAEAAIPSRFGLLPRTPCVVKAMEPHEEKFSTIAYYRPPSADGSRPGAYLVNTWRPETRPRYEAQALAFHEAVPGHHTQIAIAQELTRLPEFRRHADLTAYVEGWGLYAERLADELGLYDGDLDRLGMLSFDAWRACRLVVDTGMHALGWSREQAIAFMTESTLLAANNIENEVDRYIVWPAQALAYKLGQLELLALRDEARARLGAAFDLSAFHDRVLETGPLSLALLRRRLAAWLAGA